MLLSLVENQTDKTMDDEMDRCYLKDLSGLGSCTSIYPL